MKAMILAAGLGTRLRPLTISKPKVLLEIGGIPMLEHQINYLIHHGIREIIINVHSFKDMIREFIEKKKFDCRIEFSDESDMLLDTGGGLKKAAWFFNNGKPFVIMGSDMFTDLDLNRLLLFHEKNKALVSIAVTLRNTTRTFIIDDENMLCGWHNKITGEKISTRKCSGKSAEYGSSVIQVLDPLIFKLITEDGVFSLTKVYLRLSNHHRIMGYIHNADRWLEFGRIGNLSNKEMLSVASDIISRFSPNG